MYITITSSWLYNNGNNKSNNKKYDNSINNANNNNIKCNCLMMIMMMMNCFCSMVDRRKTFSLISSRDHCQRSSTSRISDTPQAGFEPEQNLSSGLVEWNCVVVITTTPRRHTTPRHHTTPWRGFLTSVGSWWFLAGWEWFQLVCCFSSCGCKRTIYFLSDGFACFSKLSSCSNWAIFMEV